eukprot:352550-Chlamydomonas_euryale.AAC.17
MDDSAGAQHGGFLAAPLKSPLFVILSFANKQKKASCCLGLAEGALAPVQVVLVAACNVVQRGKGHDA